jgi:hypothetical protein
LWADNELGVEGTKVIAKALESNHTMTTLNLEGTIRREKQENDMAIIRIAIDGRLRL